MARKNAGRISSLYSYANFLGEERVKAPLLPCWNLSNFFFQGTFSIYEKYAEIHDFVQDNVEHSGLPFVLSTPTGQKLNIEEDANKTLVDLKLVPATILIFAWDPSVATEIGNSPNKDVYLKPEVMVLVREM